MKAATVTRIEILSFIIDKLRDLQGADIYGCDLHSEIFNNDYYIIGRYEAEQWIVSNGSVFDIINKIKDYEQDNFGKLTTDISEPEKVVNMYVYIVGEEILSESEFLQSFWDDKLTEEQYTQLIEEFEALLAETN
jgi:uncharacterized protein YutD